MRTRTWTGVALALALAACGGGAGGDADSGRSDAGLGDAGPGLRDAGPGPGDDAGSEDGGPAAPDAGAPDAGAPDAGAPDAGAPDAGAPDAGGGPCTTEGADCGGGFCRCRRGGGGLECHPYLDEGGRCGGFRLPCTTERCRPDVGCNDPTPLLADDPGICSLTATVAELASEPGRFDGHVVAVLAGWVRAPFVACTDRACPPEMPCCNACSGGEILVDAEDGTVGPRLEDADGTPYSCRGDECTPRETCTVAPDAQYRVIGRFRADGGAGVLVVDTIQPLSFGFP